MDRRDIQELRALAPAPREELLSPERLARRKELLMREVTRTHGAEDGEIVFRSVEGFEPPPVELAGTSAPE